MQTTMQCSGNVPLTERTYDELLGSQFRSKNFWQCTPKEENPIANPKYSTSPGTGQKCLLPPYLTYPALGLETCLFTRLFRLTPSSLVERDCNVHRHVCWPNQLSQATLLGIIGGQARNHSQTAPSPPRLTKLLKTCRDRSGGRTFMPRRCLRPCRHSRPSSPFFLHSLRAQSGHSLAEADANTSLHKVIVQKWKQMENAFRFLTTIMKLDRRVCKFCWMFIK